MSARPVINLEQFEAECVAGVRAEVEMIFNQTQVAFLVIACQTTLRRTDIPPIPRAILNDIVLDLTRRVPFGQETCKLLELGKMDSK